MEKNNVMVIGIICFTSLLLSAVICATITEYGKKEKIIIKDGYNNIISEYKGDYFYSCEDMTCSDIWNNAIVPVPCGYLESYGIR